MFLGDGNCLLALSVVVTGFGPAFSLISASYLLAMSLLMLLRMPRKEESLAHT